MSTDELSFSEVKLAGAASPLCSLHIGTALAGGVPLNREEPPPRPPPAPPRPPPQDLSRYRNAERLDLTLCPRVTDASLSSISSSCGSVLRYINLSRSRFFSGTGLSRMVAECRNPMEIDLSNATDLRDAGVAALAAARNLEQLWLRRCKLITDMGVGVELVAVKCNDIRTLDLSYLRISSKCLSPILKLQYLEDLILEGCFGLDNDSLAALKHGCNSLKVTAPLAASLKRLVMLQSLKLDGCSVTNEGFSFLVARQKQLQKLDITLLSPDNRYFYRSSYKFL
ncbi:hypothetical protein SAY87_028096 [Trapa incisa]|uniref:F-box/LRR-repeat protein 15-like leucin rich repeat domain-containing protein n=1 Tax=Trapa incisa TaxID=236973 RepID=A0AAN7L1Z8_9MYRT|nr:hypothetical protein SAY87_028096 [Trapa incisa]